MEQGLSVVVAPFRGEPSIAAHPSVGLSRSRLREPRNLERLTESCLHPRPRVNSCGAARSRIPARDKFFKLPVGLFRLLVSSRAIGA